MQQAPPASGDAATIAARGWKRLFTEPARPSSIRSRPNAFWFAVATVCIGAFMNQLDVSIVTVAFPTLEHSFNATVGDVTWVSLTYLLVVVSLITAVGRVADMMGRKLLYTYGFLVFIIGSALCGLAPSLLDLNGFRVLQGIGAAMLQANSVAIIVTAVPRDKLGRAIGVQGAAQALGLALGPTIGGLLIGLGGWRLIFYVNVPVGIVGTALGWFLIPRSVHLTKKVTFDWWGLALFVPAVAAFLYAISEGDHLGWLSPIILAAFAAAIVLTPLFLLREKRCLHPLIQLAIFRRLQFSAGLISGLLSYLVLFGVLFVTPFYLERALSQSPAQTGLELASLPILLGVTAPFAGRLADRIGPEPLTVGGMALTAAGLFAMLLLHVSLLLIIVELGIIGIGLGMFTPPNNAAIMGSAPHNQSGVASGILNMTRGLGTAMGLALTGLIFGLAASSQSASHALVAEGLTYSLIFLIIVSFLAMAAAALRGDAQLNRDPLAVAE